MNNYYNEEKKRPVSASAVMRIVIWSVVLCILVALFTLGLVFEHDGMTLGISLGGYTYDDADEYNIGNGSFAGTVTDLDIEWVSGPVEIVPAAGDAVTITEEYSGSDDDLRMRWKVEDGELTVKFRAPYWLIGAGQDTSKKLTVAIPAAMLEKLDELHVSTVSGDLTVKVNAMEADVDTVSGEVELCGSFGSLNVDTVSGRVNFEGTVREADFDGTSAAVNIHLYEQANSLDMDTVSGDLHLILPDSTTGFQVTTDSVSGYTDIRGFVFDCGLSDAWGDGSMKIDMDSVSGKLIIEKETND